MVSRFGKFLLVATALAPICGAFAVNRVGIEGRSAVRDLYFWLWLGVAVVLVLSTVFFLRWCNKHLKHTSIRTTTIKPTDKDVLAFLLAYLLPLLGEKVLAFDAKPIVSFYVFGLIFVSVYHSNSYHFNPMLALLGFHFYEIECDDGLSAMLISKRTHMVNAQAVTICRITDYLFLETSDENHQPLEILHE
jgi:hypothetical protein